jgi:Cu-Zn family superoxide dismutase
VRTSQLCLILAIAGVPAVASAEDVTIKIRAISDAGIGAEIGTIRALDTKDGLRFVPRLKGLSPGEHGLHVHENPRCGNKAADGKTGAGLAAGGHFDPNKTGKHEGPKGAGHKGDLPALAVEPNGEARKSLLAPRLKVADLWGRAIVVHAGGDNYADSPQALGGGGARVACGAIIKARQKPAAKA